MLENVSMFAGLAPEDLERLESGAQKHTYRRGAIILSQGELSDSLYVVLSGRFKAYMANEDGREVLLDFLAPGDAFGELSLLDGEPRSASVMAVETSQLAVLPRRHFLECAQSTPAIPVALLQALARRTRGLAGMVGNLALMDVYGRVASALLGLAKEEVEGRRATPAITHQELASMTGASREMVTRILNDLKRGGYIAIAQHRIILQGNLPARW
ncbi:MAG TPA: Crp/Fnr family transcriptional regulator [Methylococcaceae bacterium]|nr:Crp/Fnr family transcriptional regulator [Methylococcaceae bacterium]